ncbi:recombinase family protein [Paenibacillus sp. FSL H7-689]
MNPVEAELVRKIFHMYTGGRGLRSIANRTEPQRIQNEA